jgi:hypothetical protein
LARDHECGGDVALASTECHDPFGTGVRSNEQPTKPDAHFDKQKFRKGSSGAEKEFVEPEHLREGAIPPSRSNQPKQCRSSYRAQTSGNVEHA